MRSAVSQALFTALVLATWSLVPAAGCDCGDNINSGTDIDASDLDGGEDDAGIDATPVTCDVPAGGAIGGTCGVDGDCADPSGGTLSPFCLNNVSVNNAPWPPEGFCTAFGCSLDADCGAGAVCGLLADGTGGSTSACLPACCEGVSPGAGCSTKRICATGFAGEDLGGAVCLPGTLGVADGDSCSEFADCDRNANCLDDPFQFPGGSCATLNCTNDDECAPAGGGRCLDLPGDGVGAFCVPGCVTDADCRTDQGYTCIEDGTLGRYCFHPAPGDFCDSDADCGIAGQGWSCRRDDEDFPDGYCTVENCQIDDNDSCPLDSFCVNMVGEAPRRFCADECPSGNNDDCGVGFRCLGVLPADAPPADPVRNVCVPQMAAIVQPPLAP